MPTIYDLLLDAQARPARRDPVARGVEDLDVIPANIDLSAAEVHLVNEVAREQILSRVLRRVAADYDVILIDCQPSLGLLTVNALTASHGVLIPLECEFFALRGVALLIETIDKVRDRLNPAIELDGILATMYDARTLHSREVLERVVDAFGEKVLETVIGAHREVPRCHASRRCPITEFAPEHPAAQAYRQLAQGAGLPWRRRLSRTGLGATGATGATAPAGERRCRCRRAGFRVALANFEGPFDLLLSLIAKHELDITEVSLSQRDRRVHRLPARRSTPTRSSTRRREFLVVAATLLDLKVAGLLPQGELVDAEDVALLEARDLLFARLLQYRAFKEVVALVRRHLEAEDRRHARTVRLEEKFRQRDARAASGRSAPTTSRRSRSSR